jgi:phosphoribosyl-ATP pyrophosphohydrolase
MSKEHILEKLIAVLEERKDAEPKKSYVASLYKKGPNKMAKKVGEEAVEVAIEAVRGKKKKLKEESADLLFHLLVLWTYYDIKPDDIFEILADRFGVSGHDEKAARKKD